MTVLGFGGGKLSQFEYQLAAAMGARVAIFEPAGREGLDLLNDPAWKKFTRIFPLPDDPTSAWFAVQRPEPWPDPQQEIQMGVFLHSSYMSAAEKLALDPDVNVEWARLHPDYKSSTLDQVRAFRILARKVGFEVVTWTKGCPSSLREAAPALAELEHGRWNIDKLLAGFRDGPVRDNARKIHPALVPWRSLPESERAKDSHFVSQWPLMLREFGLGFMPV